MREKNKDLIMFSAILVIISTSIYVVTRTILTVIARYTPIETVFACIMILGEFFILFCGMGYALSIFRAVRGFKEEAAPVLSTMPSVAILIPARHEPRDVLEKTFITTRNVDYKNKTIYFLDDSSEERYKQEAEELCREYGINLFRRKERHGAKAGIINDCLKQLTEQYVCVFDADDNPMPDFLKRVVPIIERDEKVSFVQTPQFYGNMEVSPVSRGSAFQQAVFYEYICEGKTINDAMFCCGTNLILRVSALKDVGGMDESTVTEDFATSLILHAKGWKSYYYNHVCTFGMGPEDLAGYFTQQFRWANGTISVFLKLLKIIITRPFALKPIQIWEYLLSGTYYFVGLAYLFIMICPIVYLLFRIPSFFANPEIYFLTYLPYLLLSLGVFFSVLRQRHYKVRDLFFGQLLGVIAFPVLIQSCVCALFGVKTVFGITGKEKGKALSYFRLWPQLLFIFVCFTAVVWGMNRFYYERTSDVFINSFWAFYHCSVISTIFYFNKPASDFKKGA